MGAHDCDCGSETIITRAARALAADPRLIAAALTAYQARLGMGEAVLAAWLGLPAGRLAILALCTRPRADDPHYDEAVAATARYVGCHADRLRELLDTNQTPGAP